MNSYGSLFRITTFGESHGVGIGVVVDGCPAGLPIDLDFIQSELARRRPGQSHITTPRNEEDRCEILSGVFEGVSTGAPVALLIANKDPRSHDYAHMAQAFRPSHADYTYEQKYGLRDHRGGGRSSARETAARVAAGAIAKLMLNREGIKPIAYVSKVGDIAAPPHEMLDLSLCETNPVRCPDAETATEMIRLIEMVRADGDTLGGVVTGIIQGVPSGLGEPVFNKLHAELGKAMLSINAVKGFEYGSGFKGAEMRGSTQNDSFYIESGKVRTRTNHSGGIQGGISNGETIYFNVAFKPVSTLGKTQQTVDRAGNEVLLTDRGRHDACVVPRAVPIVEAMAALVMADFTLLRKAYTA